MSLHSLELSPQTFNVIAVVHRPLHHSVDAINVFLMLYTHPRPVDGTVALPTIMVNDRMRSDVLADDRS